MYIVIDERYFKGFRTVLIMDDSRCEMRHVRLTPDKEQLFNRNIPADVERLWNLYDTNPKEYRCDYAKR